MRGKDHKQRKFRAKIWTKDRIHTEALKYVTRLEFARGSPSAYEAAREYGILDEVCSHMVVLRPQFTKEKLFEKALEFKHRFDFKKAYPFLYKRGGELGLLPQACSHMGESRVRKRTKDEIRPKALECSTIKEFSEKYINEYGIAKKNGWIDELCSHCVRLWEKKWDIPTIKLHALQYEYRGDFQKGSPGAYNAAYNLGILDEVCSHMKRSKCTSKSEQELFNIVKFLYPTAKKLKHTKIKIPDKPYIHGFDIDIFVPEINLGIEFDGEYYHSFKHMRRAKQKRNWSDDDILNYHKIKDDYFLSKGIKILHIKEEDWLTDKEKCVNLCLEFLKEKICNL